MTTAQEIFTDIWNHFIVNSGRHSLGPKGCMYRGPEGTRCVVGVLLQDDEYRPLFEGRGVTSLAESGWLPERLMPHLDLLRVLQRAHDDGAGTETLRRRLREFAADNAFGVTAP